MQHLALLVDDDPHTLFFLEQVLRPTDLAILKAEDGLQALEYLQDYTPSIIFLDILMPRASGLDVLGYMQEAPHLNATLAAVISSQNRAFIAQAPQLARADAYFLKPLKAKEILEIARQSIASG